jgi:hypothetical protein
MSEDAAVVMVPELTEEQKMASAKSAVQRRFDCLTREKYQAQREKAAAEAATEEQRAENAKLRAETTELRAELAEREKALKIAESTIVNLKRLQREKAYGR